MSDSNSIIDLLLLDVRATEAVLTGSAVEIESEVVGLFDQYRNRLLRYVSSMGLCAHDAEDVSQEVFLSLFRHLRLGRSRRNLPGWLFRVAHNLALKKRHFVQKQQANREGELHLAEHRADFSGNPEEQLADRQRRERLIATMRALPERDQWCLYMRAEGLTYREIATALGMSLGTVANSLVRSLERLVRVNGQ
jgi:RNA polymerase sigma-70 factor, ECF subfamily